MLKFLIKIFSPWGNGKIQNFLSLSVIAVLVLGIGIFWSIQVIFSNYYSGLISKVLQVKEEISINRNPDKKFKSVDEEDSEFFDGVTVEVQDRVKISLPEFNEIQQACQKTNIIVSPLVKDSEFSFTLKSMECDNIFKGMMIGTNVSTTGNNALRILDTVPQASLFQFNSDSAKIPVFLSQNFLPAMIPGKTFTIFVKEQKFDCICAGILEPDEMFSINLFIVPLSWAQKILKTEKYTLVGARALDEDSSDSAKQLKILFGEKYIVTHWTESLKTISSLFNSINFMVQAIVSSLFVIAFLFSLATFDTMIKRQKKNLALLLAMGMPPKVIRNGLLFIGAFIGSAGFLCGGGITWLFLKMIPNCSLKNIFAAILIKDFSFSWDTNTAIIVLIISLFVTIASAWFAGKRIFRIDPIEDLRK